MADIFVYVERTVRGIHPASALGLCMARDLGSTRGAGVFAICEGDGGDFDRSIARHAGRCGADILYFVGRDGLSELVGELKPRHVIGPATPGSLQRMSAIAGSREPTALWLDEPPLDHSKLGQLSVIHAGLLPWHDFPMELEPEYRAGVQTATLPEWTGQAVPAATGERYYLQGPNEVMDEALMAELQSLGARRIEASDIPGLESGAVFYFGPPPHQDSGPTADGTTAIPTSLGHRSPAVDLLFIAGRSARPDSSWGSATYVLRGSPVHIVRELRSQAWVDTLG